MDEEQLMVLRMLQEGKITAEEAAQLLDALSAKRADPRPVADLADEVRRAVDDVLRALPRESLAEVKEVLGQVLREGRQAASEWRHWKREWWDHRLAPAFSGRHEASALFEDSRAISATRLVVRNTRGDMRLRPAANGHLRIVARRRVRGVDPQEAERLAARLPIDIREEQDTVVVEGPGARPFHERVRVDVDIEVPAGLDLDVHLVRGDVLVDRLGRAVTVALVKGDVRITDVSRASVQAVSADVALDRVPNGVTVQLIKGDVTAAHVGGDLVLSTKRGDLSVHAGDVRRLEATTVRGDITLQLLRLAPDGAVEAHTLTGDVRIALGPEVRCRVEASTVSGDVSAGLPLQQVRRDARRLSGILHAPDSSLRVRTTRGHIDIAPLGVGAAAPPADEVERRPNSVPRDPAG